MTILLPEQVQYIIERLQTAGYEAYAVGGCVRDSILGREPQDWDITTSATPYEVKELFRRTIDTGIQHGTVTIMIGDCGYEVTTYRIDGEYEDNRHPKDVTFTDNLVEDLKRRDFTINAMAYNDEKGLVDVFGGIEDIERKIIRCVGDPRQRFDEDALRILRAVRFAAQLGYTIEEETNQAMSEYSQALKAISAERIQVELVKMLVSDHPEYLELAYEANITAVILPEFDALMNMVQNNPHHCYDVGHHTLKSMESIRANKWLRLAMLFHDMGKALTKTTDEKGIDHFYGHAVKSEEITKKVLKRLKFDNETINYVTKLVRFHDNRYEGKEVEVRKAISKIGTDVFAYLIEVQQADLLAQSTYQKEEKMQRVQRVLAQYNEIMERGDCVTIGQLAVTGSDLIQMGFPQGKQIGEALSTLLQLVLKHPEYNTKEHLEEELKGLIPRK